MFRSLILSASVAALTSLAIAGCQSTKTPTASADGASSQAVVCDQCKTTWVKVPIDNGKGRIVGYTSRKEMTCSECKTAVENFFATGQLKHACARCGGNMEICESH